jgi:hypothetical protein
MNKAYSKIVDQLLAAGFSEVESGCFKSTSSPRVIGLAVCADDPKDWRDTADELLRKLPIRQSSSWARYIVLLIEAQKTPPLAWAAAAFSQDVSRCRRIVLFMEGDLERLRLPFVGLPALKSIVNTPQSNVAEIVESVLSASLAKAFMDESGAAIRIQQLAEEERP